MPREYLTTFVSSVSPLTGGIFACRKMISHRRIIISVVEKKNPTRNNENPKGSSKTPTGIIFAIDETYFLEEFNIDR